MRIACYSLGMVRVRCPWEAADTDHDVLDDDHDKAIPSLSRLLVTMTRCRHPGLNPGDEPVTCLRVPEQVPAMS